MKLKSLYTFLFICFTSTTALAETINVLAAASLKYVLEDIKTEFLKTHQNDTININFISSGKAFAQIQNGSPTHLFIAADTSYPQKLYENGLAKEKPANYAKGKLVLMSADPHIKVEDFEILKSRSISHIAIANPKLAPYGRAAEEFLASQNLLKELSPKLAIGDSVGQATNFVLQGASEVGFSALSMVIKNTIPHLSYIIIDENMYQPINQALIIPNYGNDSKLAKEFSEFILHSEGAQALLQSYGYGQANSQE